LEEKWPARISSIAGVLHAEFGTCPVCSQEEDGRAASEFVRSAQFTLVVAGAVGQPKDVLPASHRRRSAVPPGIFSEESGDGVRAARWGCKHGGVSAAADPLEEVEKNCVAEKVSLLTPPPLCVEVVHVDLEAAAAEEGGETVWALVRAGEEDEHSATVAGTGGLTVALAVLVFHCRGKREGAPATSGVPHAVGLRAQPRESLGKRRAGDAADVNHIR